jgi:hypothetical protein
MEITDKPLKPVDVLAVVLNGNYDAAEACALGLFNYANTLPRHPGQIPAMIYHDGKWRFDMVNPWDEDGSIM